MTLVKSMDALVRHWEASSTGIVATAYEFDDGTIKVNDNQPCHRSFGPSFTIQNMYGTTYMPQGYTVKNMKAAIVKLSYLSSIGYCGGGNGFEMHSAEYDKKAEAYYDFLLSTDGPWRGLDREIYTDSKGKYRALRIPDVDKQEFQYWMNMCFASRAGAQRANAIRLWYDLINEHGFHPTEAYFIMSGLMYNSDQKSIQFNPIAYDWPFKGYNEVRTDFYRLWNGTPNIKVKGVITSGMHYSVPNDIWVVDKRKNNSVLDFVEMLQTKGSYTGAFGSFHSKFSSNQQSYDLPTTKQCIEKLKEMKESWPR